MKSNFGHNATTSFTLWLEYFLLSKGEAYSNFESNLYFIEDPRLPEGFFRYSSPYKQWAYETINEEINIPQYIIKDSEIQINRQNKNFGYFVDFQNGGIVVTGEKARANLDLKAEYSAKEFNIYNTNETEENLIIENKFEQNSRFAISESPIPPYDIVTPAIFINTEYIRNEPLFFGGEDKTTIFFKTVVFAENLYQLDGVLSLLADSRHVGFYNCDFGDHPINEYGDLKDLDGYKYTDFHESKLNEPTFYIDRVSTSKIAENASKFISPSLFVGFIDFEVATSRFPRSI